MKTFVGIRDTKTGQCRVYVDDEGNAGARRQRLFHRRGIHSHSPTGFEWGYGGSGPAELARAIVAEVLHVTDPEPSVYQTFKFRVVAAMPKAGWTLTEHAVREQLAVIEHELAARSRRRTEAN